MRTRLATAAALGLVMLLATGGTALAKPVKAKASIQEGSECFRTDPNGAILGTVTFKRTREFISLTAVLKGALPDHEYTVTLMHAIESGCSSGKFGRFTTNKRGNGRVTVSEHRPLGETQFAVIVAASFDEVVGGTPYVSLP